MYRTEAEQARDEAVARVSAQLTDDQLLDGIIIVAEAAKRKPDITTDDVNFDFPPNVSRRAMVALMNGAAREGFIEKTDMWRKSIDPVCHARPKNVWRSLVYEPA